MRALCLAWIVRLAACFWVAAPLVAQTTGRIEGQILDGAGQAMPGAAVVATSPSLQGERRAVADPDGRFRLLVLPPGRYAVRASHDGFNPVEVADLQVDLGHTVTLELGLSEAFGEEIKVTVEAPALDLTTTTTGADFSLEVLRDLPTSRTFQGLAMAAPGVSDGGLGDSPSVRGASAAENRYVVDGLDTTDVGFGMLYSSLAFELIAAVEVKTGGYPAEYGGALGGVVNVITRSGGNELRGDLFGFFSDDDLQASAPAAEKFGRNLGFTKYDFGVDVGGRIVRDELWYFAALNPATSEEELTNRQDLGVTTRMERLYHAGKLTWQIHPRHHLVASAFGDPTDFTDVGRRPGVVFEARNAAGRILHDTQEGARSYALSLTSTLSSKLLLEISAGRFSDRKTMTPLNDETPVYEDLSGGFWARQQGCGAAELLHGNGILFAPTCLGSYFAAELDGRRSQLRGSLSRFWRGHEWKAGVEHRKLSYKNQFRFPAPFDDPLVDALGQVIDPDGITGASFQLFPQGFQLVEIDQDALGETTELAFFVQDRWQVTPSLSFNLGVRFNSFEATGPLEAADRVLDFGPGEMIAPRFGLTWDVAGNGRSKLFGHFGRFYESMPLTINSQAFGAGEISLYSFFYPADGSLPAYDNLGPFFSLSRSGLGRAVDPDVDAMFTDEAVFGFEVQVRSGVVVGISGVYREVGSVIEDISLDGGTSFLLTNPGGTYRVNPVTGEELAEAVLFPSPVREYRALELSLDRRLRHNWQLFASYVYSSNEGNYSGLYSQDSNHLLPHLTGQFNLAPLLDGAYGPLPNDRTHHVKAYGSYVLPAGLVAGFFGEVQSGTPISRLGSHPTQVFSSRFIRPRGSDGRTPVLWHLDLHLRYPLSVSSAVRLALVADVFNVTDEQRETAVDQRWTFARLERTVDPAECGGPETDCPWGNPLWGTPTAYQAPRTVRLGVKVSW